MEKKEMNVVMNRPVNPAEHAELVTLKQQINEMRYQVGLNDEQIKELEAAKVQAHASISSLKQAFRDRVQNIAKSQGLDLGVLKDGVVWQFDEPNLMFVPRIVGAGPNGKPVEASPPSNGSAEPKADAKAEEPNNPEVAH